MSDSIFNSSYENADQLMRQIVGAASVCWVTHPDGERVFDSEKALQVAAEGLERLKKVIETDRLREFVHKHGLQFATVNYGPQSNSDSELSDAHVTVVDSYEDATGISSYVAHNHGASLGLHLPVLDLDMDAVLVESSTPGHHHLVINYPMPRIKYMKFLQTLADFGLVQDGYAGASKRQHASWIRTPWTKKESK